MNEEAMTPDKEQVVEPLSDLQLAALRDVIREKSANGGMISARNAERLLATLDAARTASVVGLDRERLAEALFYTFGDGTEGEFHGEGEQRSWLRHATTLTAYLAAFNSAPSIEQEPGETLRAALTRIEAWTRDAKGISRPTLRDLLALIHDTARAALEADRNPQETER